MRIHRVFPDSLKRLSFSEHVVPNVLSSECTALWMLAEDWLAIESMQIPKPGEVQRLCEFSGDTDREVAEKFFCWLNHEPRKLWEDIKVDKFVFVFSGFPELKVWHRLKNHQQADILFRPKTLQDALEIYFNIPNEKLDNIYFEFLPWSPEKPFRTTVGEIRELIKRFARYRPDFQIKGYPGLESRDDRSSIDLNLEAEVNLMWETRVSSRQPLISIVTPTYNNSLFVQSMVLSILEQTLPAHTYEMILVDDGSTDDTFERITALVKSHERKINFSFINFRRLQKRNVGDNQFRAGAARNLGVKKAKGQWLQFLDSDMVVRPQFLENIIKSFEIADVIQCPRFHILPEFSNRILRYSDIDQNSQIFIEEEPYWANYFLSDDWMSMNNHWKYTCSYSLTLRRKDFIAAGRFKRNFTSYGFEDVDLGYELALNRNKFYLLNERTLHLTPKKERSEYAHSQWRRHRLLSRTARTFFRQHLDPNVYDSFFSFMQERPTWARFKARMLGDRP